jgi:DtxR family Mn-dependent transcriptional regulator
VHSGYHPPVEEYLKVVFELEEEDVAVIRARLAERLGHSGPTVGEVVRRLVADGHLEERDRELRLTAQGRQRAEAVVRKHRLAERLLVDVVGLDWAKAHQEAERWEHVISDDAEERIVVLLGHPATCPHGNPIPGSGTARAPERPLSSSQPGEQVRLSRLTETVEVDFDTLVYLDSYGFRPGCTALVKDRSPDGALTLALGDAMMAVSPALASQLYVHAGPGGQPREALMGASAG